MTDVDSHPVAPGPAPAYRKITVTVGAPDECPDMTADNPVLAAVAGALGTAVSGQMTQPGCGMILRAGALAVSLPEDAAEAVRQAEQGRPPRLRSFTVTTWPEPLFGGNR